MHGSKLSLTIWFWATYLMVSHSNGISTLQLQKQLGLGSYKTAWFLAVKLRLARRRVVSPPKGLVEADDGQPGRISLVEIENFSATSLHGFLADNLAKAVTAKTDGWAACPDVKNINYEPHMVGPMAAHIVLPWIHRVFANFKTWAHSVYHGLRRAHLQTYLDEFVFRFNRRRNRHAGFARILAIALGQKPVAYSMLIKPDAQA